jgi:hypothetical protein
MVSIQNLNNHLQLTQDRQQNLNNPKSQQSKILTDYYFVNIMIIYVELLIIFLYNFLQLLI